MGDSTGAAVGFCGEVATETGAVVVRWPFSGGLGGAGFSAEGGLAAAGCGRRWPRNCFSSHSTQKVRPWETGKPHAWHFCKFLKTGGTVIDSTDSRVRAAAGVCRAADQKSGFP